jgi:hypothetical protein
VNDAFPDAPDDRSELAAQARQQGGRYRLFLLALTLLLGVAVLLVLVLNSGSHVGT